MELLERRKLIQTKIIDEEYNGVEAYKKHLEEIKEAKKKKLEDGRLQSELTNKKVIESHQLASAPKGNSSNGRIRFINNKGISDAVEELNKVVDRISIHNERY